MTSTKAKTWCILCGEYPPKLGGVGDYSSLVAEGLLKRQQSVFVFTPQSTRTSTSTIAYDAQYPTNQQASISVDWLNDGFTLRGLRELGVKLNMIPDQRVLLIQYTPQSFGYKSLNLFFAFWIVWRSWMYRDDIRIMFHEFAFPFKIFPLKHCLLAIVHRCMGWLLLRVANKVYVSTVAWVKLVRTYGPRSIQPIWAPVPSNVPEVARVVNPQKNSHSILLGHFGTYGSLVLSLLDPIIEQLLLEEECIELLLIGNGGQYRTQLLEKYPAWETRVTTTGELEIEKIGFEIAQCKAMIQPYGDGINSRRGSAMAALCNHVPVITNRSFHTDEIWNDSNVCFAISDDIEATIKGILDFISSQDRCESVAAKGYELYQTYFAIERTIEKLLNDTIATDSMVS